MYSSSHLLDTPNATNEAELMVACFGIDMSSKISQRNQVGEFRTYLIEQSNLLQKLHAPGGIGCWFLPIETYTQLVRVIRVLQRHGHAERRPRIRDVLASELSLTSESANDEILNSIIDAALRTWLMVNFLNPKHRSVTGGQAYVEWDDDTTLKKRIETLFPHTTTELTLSQRRLHPHFTAANMVRICRIKIEWTSSLENHLRLDRESRRLWIYDRRQTLLLKARSYGEITHGTLNPVPFPEAFFEETSRTLDLLFPAWDRRTKTLLQSSGKTFHLHHAKQRSLDLKNYPFWQDQLLELNEDVFLAPAEGWARLWLDRRDPQKFWTFWVALAIFILTIVSTVASILQTWATLKSFNGG